MKTFEDDPKMSLLISLKQSSILLFIFAHVESRGGAYASQSCPTIPPHTGHRAPFIRFAISCQGRKSGPAGRKHCSRSFSWCSWRTSRCGQAAMGRCDGYLSRSSRPSEVGNCEGLPPKLKKRYFIPLLIFNLTSWPLFREYCFSLANNSATDKNRPEAQQFRNETSQHVKKNTVW